MSTMVTKQELIRRHGTLEEFSRAVEAAVDDLMVTPDEASAAIRKYEDELAAAPEDCVTP
jgi:hypothetical protein